MRRILTIAIALVMFGAFPIYAQTGNTHSIDLVKGSSQYLSAADSTSLSVTGDLTIEAWIKIAAIDTVTNPAIITKSNLGSQEGYQLHYAVNGTDVLIELSSTGSNRVAKFFPYQFQAQTWTHVAMVYTASLGKIEVFINGSSIGSQMGLPISIYDNTEPLRIGALNNNGVSQFFDGKIDEARIWNVARTASQISANFQIELAGNESGLVAYYKLNNSLLDSTSNGNNLVNNNGATFSIDVSFTGPSPIDNLDVPLSTRNAEATQLLIKAKIDNIDILLSALRDAITAPAPNNKTLKDLFDQLQSVLNQLDVALSTRASESTLILAKSVLDSIKAKTDNLDVLLSTRAGETTQLLVKSTLDAIKTKTDNLDVLLSSRASELTLQGVKAGTDKIPIDPAREGGNLAGVKTNTDTLVARTPKPWQFYTDSGKGFGVVIDGLILPIINRADVLLIKDPSSSGIVTRLKRLYASPDRDFINIEIYRNPTITSNGMPITPFNHKASGGPATTQVFQNPVISSRGVLVFTGKLGAFLKTIDFDLARFLEAGENLLVVLQADRANIEVDLTLDFAEE